MDEMKFLEEQRDRNYQGDWEKMLGSLRYQSRNRNADPEYRNQLKRDIEKIEIFLEIRPKEGFKYLNGHCRIPANLIASDFEKAYDSIKNAFPETEACSSDSEIDIRAEIDLALLATKEILFMINRAEREEQKRIPINY